MKKLFVKMVFAVMMASLSAESVVKEDLKALNEIRSSMEGQTTNEAYKPSKKKTRYSRYNNIKYVVFWEDSTKGITNNWSYIKQNTDDICKYVTELVTKVYPYCDSLTGRTLIKKIAYSYGDRKECITWAEEHFKPRGGHNLTLSSEEYEYFSEWFTRSAKQYNANLHAYQHWLKGQKTLQQLTDNK